MGLKRIACGETD